MDIKGTKTEKILTAFAGEAQARTKYTFYLEAKRVCANRQHLSRDHGKRKNTELWFKLLNNGIPRRPRTFSTPRRETL